jgi:hypothetical protein
LRGLRIAAPVQLSLKLRAPDEEPPPQELWQSLPDEAQARLLSLFARLIARSVVIEEKEAQ